MRVVRFVHLTYEVLRDLPVSVYSLWSLYGVVCQPAVQKHTSSIFFARLDPMALRSNMRVVGTYTYCGGRYGTYQFVCTAYVACRALYVRVLYRTVQRVYLNSV